MSGGRGANGPAAPTTGWRAGSTRMTWRLAASSGAPPVVVTRVAYPEATMAIFVLVHSSYQGGWIWKLVGDRLLDAGHRVYRPTLAGNAERRRELSPDLTLNDYGADLADLLLYEDLSDAILVGTSIGGM